MDRGRQDLILGVVFFAGLGLLLYATFTLTTLFNTPEKLSIWFSNASGLRKGDPVFVLGHRLGEVSTIAFDPEKDPTRRIRIEVTLQQRVTFTTGDGPGTGYRVAIKNSTLLGGKMIDIDPGAGGDVYTGALTGDVLADDLVGMLLDDPDIRQIVEGIKEFVATINNQEGTVYRLFAQDDIYTEIERLIGSANRSLEAIENGPGVLNDLIYGEQLSTQLRNAGTQIEEFTTALNEGDGPIAALTHDAELTESVRGIVDNLAGSESLLGRAINDPELGDRGAKLVDEFASVGEKLNDPDAGLIGGLIGDEQMLANGRKFLDDLAAIGDDVRNGDGLLARLINDPELGEQFSRMINQVSRAIEDAREAAPVGTFFQVFSGAF